MRKNNLILPIEEIIEKHRNNVSITDLSKMYKISRTKLSKLMRSFLNVEKLQPISTINTYFDKIDSTDKAYILGFIAADGAIVFNKKSNYPSLTITIKYTDHSLINYIKNQINPSSNLLEIKRPSSYDKTKEIHHIRFSYGNRHLVESLMRLGIYPNKSLTMKNIIENVPEIFRNAFIIGYLDGDGNISLPKSRGKYNKSQQKNVNYPSHRITINFRGTKDFLQGIVNHLDLKGKIHHYDSIPTLNIGDKSDITKIFNCYEGLNFFLIRKYDKFFPRINHPSYDIYKQDQTISSSQ